MSIDEHATPAAVPLIAKDVIQRWLERTFPGDIHVNHDDDGYYAAGNSSGPSPKRYHDVYDRAQVRYYASGGGGKCKVLAKLQIAAKQFDAMRVTYTWYMDSYDYPYILAELTADECTPDEPPAGEEAPADPPPAA